MLPNPHAIRWRISAQRQRVKASEMVDVTGSDPRWGSDPTMSQTEPPHFGPKARGATRPGASAETKRSLASNKPSGQRPGEQRDPEQAPKPSAAWQATSLRAKGPGSNATRRKRRNQAQLGKQLVRTVGLEPTRSFELRILSPVCLPFHHVRGNGAFMRCRRRPCNRYGWRAGSRRPCRIAATRRM